jgi:hypothetical protein
LLAIIVFNCSWGPWAGEAWFSRVGDEANNYACQGSQSDLVLLWVLHKIGLEMGIPESVGVSAEEVWRGLPASNFLHSKGERVLLTRWGSWLKAANRWIWEWSKRTCILMVYGIQFGFCTDSAATGAQVKGGGPSAGNPGEGQTMKQQREDVRAF